MLKELGAVCTKTNVELYSMRKRASELFCVCVCGGGGGVVGKPTRNNSLITLWLCGTETGGWKLQDMRVTCNYTFGKDTHWTVMFK